MRLDKKALAEAVRKTAKLRVEDVGGRKERPAETVASCLSRGYNTLGSSEGIEYILKHAIRCYMEASLPTSDGWRTKAVEDVLAERKRQIEAEGWTPEHDNVHSDGQMAAAAACYALASDGVNYVERLGMRGHVHQRRIIWPWGREWWKPSSRRRNLVKAGALILAEIERLDRIPAGPTATGGR